MMHIVQHYLYILNKVIKGVISMPHIALSDQLTEIFTKPLKEISYDSFGTKLDMFDKYTST